MTSIPSLTIPSLVDYLTNNGAGAAGIGGMSAGGATDLASILNANDGGDVVSLSAQAQALLAQQSNNTPSSSATSSSETGDEAKKNCADFILKFLSDSGVDATSLSDETKTLLSGISDLITNMTNVSRDGTVDSMTKAYVKGQRESYTLSGDGQRLSATIQYDGGKPASLTVTQINGTVANTAKITLAGDDKGDLSTLNIDRIQKTYNSFGGLMGTASADPLTLALYA